jgi:predicted nucleotidyltransferase
MIKGINKIMSNTQEQRMNDKKVYDDLITSLTQSFGKNLKTVVLFGSRAKNMASEKSDHDIFLVIKGLSDDPLLRLKQVRYTVFDVPLRINFITKTPDEVASNLSPLFLDIFVDGVCLFGVEYFETFRQKALNVLKISGLKRKRAGNVWYWGFEKTPKKEWELTWEEFREL